MREGTLDSSALMAVHRIAYYARVSSEQQSKAATIESQLADIRQRLTTDGLVAESAMAFVDDGYSGTSLFRPALEALRDEVAAGAIDRVYVHSPDRLARKYAYQVLLVDEFMRAGVEIVFLNRPLGKTPEDNMLLQVQGMVAEYERAKIMERCRRGRIHAARGGSVSVLKAAPYGYRYVNREQGGGEARYEIIDERAQIVRSVFDWIVTERLTLRGVADRLTERAIPTAKGSGRWNPGTIQNMLRNPAYAGRAAFGRRRMGPRVSTARVPRGQPLQPKREQTPRPVPQDEWIEIPVPAIVSEEVFVAAQAQLEENRKRSRALRRGNRYLLRGLTVCECCGYAYVGHAYHRTAKTGKALVYTYYHCMGRHGGRQKKSGCSNAPLRGDRVEESVWEDVKGLLLEPDRLWEEHRRRLGSDGTTERDDGLELLHARIKKQQSALSRLLDAYQEGLLRKDEFTPRIQGARARLERMQAEARAMQEKRHETREFRLVVGQLKEFAERTRETLKTANWEMRRNLILLLIKEIRIDHEKVHIIYRIGKNVPNERLLIKNSQDCPNVGKVPVP